MQACTNTIPLLPRLLLPLLLPPLLLLLSTCAGCDAGL
jgi:hypothetical protein